MAKAPNPLSFIHEVDRLLTGIIAQQKGTTVRWYSNKTSLSPWFILIKFLIYRKNLLVKASLSFIL